MNKLENFEQKFHELAEHIDTETTQRIRDRLKTQQKSRLKKFKESNYGYDVVDGRLVVNQKESKVVRWIFERYLYYFENPPTKLVEIVIERAKEYGKQLQNLSYEEAKSLVNSDLILEFMAHELTLKGFYYQALAEKDPSIKFDDILSADIDTLPTDKLEKLMDGISRLDFNEKKHEYLLLLNRVPFNALYNGSTEFTAKAFHSKGRKSFEHRKMVLQDHEAIISPELFEAAQEKLRPLKKPKIELDR